MASLHFQEGCFLHFEPIALKHDSFNGWLMHSDVIVSMESIVRTMGCFMSGPKFRNGLWQFSTESLVSYMYEPKIDGDLPGEKMSIAMERVKGGIEFAIKQEYSCEIEDHDSWMDKTNSVFKNCGIIGAAHYQAQMVTFEELAMIYSRFRVVVSEDAMAEFIYELIEELDEKEQAP